MNIYYQLRQPNHVSKDSRDSDNDRLANEMGDIGIWYICPECMSKEVWEISCKFKDVRRAADESRCSESSKSLISFSKAPMAA